MHARGYSYIANTNSNVIMITNNGSIIQALKSVGKDTSAVSVDVYPDSC